jgi:hypothetical protein
MKSLSIAVFACALGGVSFTASVSATTATSLGSFGGVEEPNVIYDPNAAVFTPDSFVNITDQGGGTVRMFLRYRPNQWWDGDRDTTSTDRQRAEIKVLGPRQKPGETFEYASTWRTDPAMVVGNHFCHITQVKGYGGGDIGSPLVTTTLLNNTTAAVRYDSGTASGLTAVRSFSWTPNEWKTVAYRLTVSSVDGAADGGLVVSVNGDAFTGLTNVGMYRPGAPEYQPKWGLYRGLDSHQPFGDDYMEHTNVSANKLSSAPPPPPPPGVVFEAESIPRSSVGATTAPNTDGSSSGGIWIALNATAAGPYVEYTCANIPAGTYNLLMKYKAHPSRGILALALDGVTLFSGLDQYSANPAYPERDFGVVHFNTAGSHVIRLTCLGKNPASGAYTLSADRFSFLKDNVAPDIEGPDDMTLEATSAAGAVATYTVTATDDKDGAVPVTVTPASGSTFPLGTTTVHATASDSTGNTASTTFNVTVVDTTSPAINRITPSLTTLWPATHRMIGVTLAVDATDTVDATPTKKIISVSSNEPETGTGNGDVGPDWQITGDLTLNLRAERASAGTGRVYTITVQVTDASGNASVQTTQVSVPKTQPAS